MAIHAENGNNREPVQTVHANAGGDAGSSDAGPVIAHSLVRFVAVLAIALALAGCGRSESYRYKLTLAVNTPDGIKRGSSVVEVLFWDVSIPAKGTMHRLRGEALYLDLGPGARPLIALLTHRLHPRYDDGIRWSPEAGPDTRLLMQLYGETPSKEDFVDDVPRIAAKRGPRRIAPNDLPDLLTFADVNDPKTVIEVDRNDLRATFGPNITWDEITLESTDEPITKGIETKLRWIPAYWCGMLEGRLYDGKTLANKLSTWDFDQSDEYRDTARRKHQGDSYVECWKSRTEWRREAGLSGKD